MKIVCVSCWIALFLCACSSAPDFSKEEKNRDYVAYVNPLVGTDSDFSLSNGNTYPAIALPWGMNFWTPMTNKMGEGWTYQYDANKLRGIKQTHQPSPWINDYAAFSLMAVTGKLRYQEEERASWFSHKAETAKPNYYKVYLADYDITAELAPTERAAQFRFTFPKSDSAYIILDAFFKGSMVKIFPEERKVIGYCRNNNGGVPENFYNYFVAIFDKDFTATHTWTDGWTLQENSQESEGEHVGAILKFQTERGEQVGVRVASSFISPQQALQNLNAEIAQDTFEETRQKGWEVWQKELSRIAVETKQKEDIKTFYSNLYRTLLFPRKFYEITESGEILHYSPYNGKVEKGYMFTDNGFWDTFRAVFPFFNMMYPSLTSTIMEGLANTYKESGWLPEWASPGHRDCMIGSNSAINIADAYLKGNVKEETAKILFEAVLKNAEVEAERPVSSVGREGLDYYNKLGYVPYDVGINENAARTLEYAFADFAIAKMAEKRNEPEIAKRFFRQSQNYKNLFDPETKLIRGKNKDGSFQTPFNPLKWGDAFTEGNSLHYTWSVFHDMSGLVDLMGGRAAFSQMLDTVFSLPPRFDDSYYGFTIHEIREMQIVNMGNYAHGNQPIQHMIYLYNYAGKPYKAQQKVREVLAKLYSPMPDGYCGDEDNGQTSAWYVFSSLGFYPVTPTSPNYLLGSPLFEKITLHLENGNTFRIQATNNSPENVYVEKVLLNGKTWDKSYLPFVSIQEGGVLEFDMNARANKKRAVAVSAME